MSSFLPVGKLRAKDENFPGSQGNLTIEQASDSQVELFPLHHADEWGRKSEDLGKVKEVIRLKYLGIKNLLFTVGIQARMPSTKRQGVASFSEKQERQYAFQFDSTYFQAIPFQLMNLCFFPFIQAVPGILPLQR